MTFNKKIIWIILSVFISATPVWGGTFNSYPKVGAEGVTQSDELAIWNSGRLKNLTILQLQRFWSLVTGSDTIDMYGDDLAAAVAMIGTTEKTLIVKNPISISSDLSVPATLCVQPMPGCRIEVATGKTLTINNLASATGRFQWISSSSPGAITLPGCGNIFPEWWGAKAATTTDSTTAFQHAVDCAIRSGAGILLSSGTYAISSTVTASLDMSGALYQYQPFRVRGEGKNVTQVASSVDGPALWIKGSQFQLSDFTMRNTVSGNSSEGIRLGDDANHYAASEGSLRDIKILYFLKGIVCEIVWDSLFDRVEIQSGLAGGIGIDVLPSTWDNSNSLTFSSVHVERIGPNGTLFKAEGGGAGSLSHHAFSFTGCHFESNYYTTSDVYLKNVGHASFLGCTFRQNNRFGELEADRIPIILLDNANMVRFAGGYITTSCVTSTASRLVKILGNTANIFFSELFFEDYANNPSGLSLAGILDSSEAGDADGSGVYFQNIVAEDYKNVALNSREFQGSSYRRFSRDTNHDLEQERIYYDHYTQEHSGTALSTDPIQVIGKYGSISGGLPRLVANGASATWYIETSTFTNGAAIIIILADTPTQTAGIFFKRGTNIWPISALSGIVVGTPGASQFGLTAPTNGTISISNNYGSDRSVSLLVIGAQ